MAKFSFKSLFIKEEDSPENAAFPEVSPKVEIQKNTNPPPPKFETPLQVPHDVDTDLFEQVLDMYQKGFETLNKEGYDFFEFFKSIVAVGADNEQAYKMAFQIAQSMSPNISKTQLLDDASYYSNELKRVHQNFSTQGEQKKADITKKQADDERKLITDIEQLSNSIEKLKAEILKLEAQKSAKEAQLSPLKEKGIKEVEKIDKKLVASDHAHTSIIKQIENVKDGIIRYV